MTKPTIKMLVTQALEVASTGTVNIKAKKIELASSIPDIVKEAKLVFVMSKEDTDFKYEILAKSDGEYWGLDFNDYGMQGQHFYLNPSEYKNYLKAVAKRLSWDKLPPMVQKGIIRYLNTEKSRESASVIPDSAYKTNKAGIEFIKKNYPGIMLSFNKEDHEYTVKIKGKPKADYFTDDLKDAILTARSMYNASRNH